MNRPVEASRVELARILNVPTSELADGRLIGSYMPDSMQMAELAARMPESDGSVFDLNARTISAVLQSMASWSRDQIDPHEPGFVPRLSTPEYELVSVRREMTEALFRLSTDPQVSYRWRFRGAIPSLEAFEASLWQSVVAQFVVVETGRTELLGHVVCFGVDAAQQHAYIGAVFTPRMIATGRPIQPIALFLNYIFTTWNLRKLYMEVPEFNMSSLWSGAGSFFKQEACFREHDYYAGRYWDKYVLAVYRRDLAAGLRRLGLSSSMQEHAVLGQQSLPD